MTSSELSLLLRTRRSIRHFRDDPVDRNVIAELLQDAAWAPSGGNAQPWAVTAVDPGRTRQALARCERRLWNALLPRVVAMRARSMGSGATTRDALQDARDAIERDVIVTGAPWMLIVWSRHDPIDPELVHGVHRTLESQLSTTDVPSLAAMHDMVTRVDQGVTDASVSGFVYASTLAAHARGLGTCIQHSWLAFADELPFPPPSGTRLAAIVLLGWPDPTRKDGSPHRRSVDIDWG